MAILIEGLDLPKNGKDLLSINIKPNGDVIRDMDIECEVIAHAIEPKLCASCPYNPVEAMIRNGGEDVCPDAFKPVAVHCNYNYNCQIRDDDR